MKQYPLPLSLPPVYSADNFFVSDSNREAWQWITAWPNWPSHALLLYGPPGSGKSHLAHIWRERAGANHRLIEDIEGAQDERELLHQFNYAKENGESLLLTSAVAAAQLPFTLKDLTSRLLAIPSASIATPDDALLAGAMRKQFADRQIKVEDDVIAYITARMERSLVKVKELVELIDKETLAQHKHLTIPFIRRLLEW